MGQKKTNTRIKKKYHEHIHHNCPLNVYVLAKHTAIMPNTITFQMFKAKHTGVGEKGVRQGEASGGGEKES